MPSAHKPTIAPEDPEGCARKVIYDRLAVRAQSRSDLAQALAKKLVPEEVASAMLDKFEAAGLIDDEEFARAWVQSRQRSKGLSSRVLAMELRQKGVDDEISKEVLAELDPADELAGSAPTRAGQAAIDGAIRRHHQDPPAHQHARPQGLFAADRVRRRTPGARRRSRRSQLG